MVPRVLLNYHDEGNLKETRQSCCPRASRFGPVISGSNDSRLRLPSNSTPPWPTVSDPLAMICT